MVFPRRDRQIYEAIQRELGPERYAQLHRQGQLGIYGWAAAAVAAFLIGYESALKLLPVWIVGIPSAFLFLRTQLIFSRTRKALQKRGEL